MSLITWRIGSETPDYTADDRSGMGASKTGGRWNRTGLCLVYTSSTISLSCLETIVHFNALDLPMNRYLVKVEIPKALIHSATNFDSTAHVGWDCEPCGKVSLDFGDNWIRALSSAVLIVPSAIIPEEKNYLINPNHPDAASVKFTKIRRFSYDARIKFATTIPGLIAGSGSNVPAS